MRFEITHHVFVYDTNSFSGACASDLLRILYCTMFFSRHQARRLSPTHRHRTASRRTRLCLTHMYLGGGQAVDTSGTHGLSCRQSAGRHARHRAVSDLIKRALASADVLARLEPSTLSRDDGKCPDGLSTAPWKEGHCLVWDFICPDTLAASHLDRAVSGRGR